MNEIAEIRKTFAGIPLERQRNPSIDQVSGWIIYANPATIGEFFQWANASGTVRYVPGGPCPLFLAERFPAEGGVRVFGCATLCSDGTCYAWIYAPSVLQVAI